MLWRTGLTVGLCALTALLGSPGLGLQGALTVAVFLLVGLPHGSLDHLVARRAFGVTPTLLYSGYLAIAALAWLAWWVAPVPALLGFLMLSAWHFGEGDVRGLRVRAGLGPVLILSRGLLIVGSLLWAWPSMAPDMIGMRLDGFVRTPATPFLLGGQHALVVLAVVQEDARQRARLAAEAFVLAAWLWIAEPLFGFTAYFGLWHSWDHLRVLGSALADETGQHWTGLWSRSFPNALVSALGLCVLVAAGVSLVDGEAWFAAGLAGLGAIATPHLVLVEAWRWRSVAATGASEPS